MSELSEQAGMLPSAAVAGDAEIASDCSGDCSGDSGEAMPLCLHCLTPYIAGVMYCPECGKTVGQFAAYDPIARIAFSAEQRSSFGKDAWPIARHPTAWGVFRLMLIVLLGPLLLIALPFILLERWRSSRSSKH